MTEGAYALELYESMTADNGLQRAVLLWNSREVTDIPPEFVLMEHPLILARRPDRDVELLDAARTVGVRQTCGGGSGVGRGGGGVASGGNRGTR
jgi:hypothetical protein